MHRAPIDETTRARHMRPAETQATAERERVREAAEILAEEAERLASSEDRLEPALSLAAAALRDAIRSHPDRPDWWIRVGPFVVERSGAPKSLVEMMLEAQEGGAPRRLASVLLRALAWRLPG